MCKTLTYKGRECKVLGTVGASRPCDCCGNAILEKAIAIEVEGCDVYEIGCVCAAKNIFGDGRCSRKVKALAEAADFVARENARHERDQIAFRMVHAVQTEMNKLKDDDPRHLALKIYRLTGRPTENQRLYVQGDWVVAVDVGCERDKARWTSLGFVRYQQPN